jgi:hypothetical protein
LAVARWRGKQPRLDVLKRKSNLQRLCTQSFFGAAIAPPALHMVAISSEGVVRCKNQKLNKAGTSLRDLKTPSCVTKIKFLRIFVLPSGKLAQTDTTSNRRTHGSHHH